MTPERLAEIQARLAAATPGPWGTRNGRTTVYAVNETGVIRSRGQRCAGDEFPMVARVSGDANAALIAHAPTDLADLLAYVEQLEGLLRDLCEDSRAAAEVVRLRKEVGEIADACKRRAAWSGALLSGDDVARALRDAFAPPVKE